jgi:hypothetical protein
MLLRRRVGTSTTAFTDAPVHGKSIGYRPEELVGGVVQGDRRVKISQLDIAAAGWPGPPRKNDVLDGGAVQGAEPLYDGAELVGFTCWVRG